MNTNTPDTLKNHYKIQASILLKKIKIISQQSTFNKNNELIENTLLRLKQLAYFAEHTPKQIFNELNTIQLKHCLDIIAIENGHLNWHEFLQDSHADINNGDGEIEEYDTDGYELYRYNLSEGALNAWYNNYEEAKIHLDRSGGYLLTYNHQYFVCQATHISGLGVDPTDNDWNLIGKNWAKPNDSAAKIRLIEKLKQAQKGSPA